MRGDNVSPIDWAKCGTPANYRRHYRLGETPCEKCRREFNARRTARRQAMRRCEATTPSTCRCNTRRSA